jgi:hypothetical protein
MVGKPMLDKTPKLSLENLSQDKQISEKHSGQKGAGQNSILPLEKYCHRPCL